MRAGAPDADAAAGEGPDAVDPALVQAALLLARDLEGDAVDAEVTSFAGRLVDAAGPVGAAHTPATWPDGGTSSGRFVIGSMTSSHG